MIGPCAWGGGFRDGDVVDTRARTMLDVNIDRVVGPLRVGGRVVIGLVALHKESVIVGDVDVRRHTYFFIIDDEFVDAAEKAVVHVCGWRDWRRDTGLLIYRRQVLAPSF